MTLKTIKHFRFDQSKKLGEGSTGTVYLGTDLRNNSPIAVKAIDLKNIDNQVTQYLLKNEIKALGMTNHPNVLKAIDVIQEPQFVYIVTQYLPKGTLAEYIQKLGFISQSQALQIFKHIVDGYDHIFDLHIYHRDLKPHNILFDSNLRPVLSDFGYCQITGFLPKPKLKYNVGSPGFMAPESLVGNLYSENSEVWSLGAILYEMMTGKNYTNGKPVMQAVMLIKKQGPYYPDNASPLTKEIIRQCMKLKPQNRLKVKALKKLLHDNIKSKVTNRNSVPLNYSFGNLVKANQQIQVNPISNNAHPSIFVTSSQQMRSTPSSVSHEYQLNNPQHISPNINIPITASIQIPTSPTAQESINMIPNNIQSPNQAPTSVTFNPSQITHYKHNQPIVNAQPPQKPLNRFESNFQTNIIRNVSPRKKAQRASIVGTSKPEESHKQAYIPSILKNHVNNLPVQSINILSTNINPAQFIQQPELVNQRGQELQKIQAQKIIDSSKQMQLRQQIQQMNQSQQGQVIQPAYSIQQKIQPIQQPIRQPIQQGQNQISQQNSQSFGQVIPQQNFQVQQNKIEIQSAPQQPTIQTIQASLSIPHQTIKDIRQSNKRSNLHTSSASAASGPDYAPFYMPNLEDQIDQYDVFPTVNAVGNRNTISSSPIQISRQNNLNTSIDYNVNTIQNNHFITQQPHSQPQIGYKQGFSNPLINNQQIPPQQHIIPNNQINGGVSLPIINQQQPAPTTINMSSSMNNMANSFQGLKSSFAQPSIMHPVPTFNSQYRNVILPNPYNYGGY